MWWFRRSAFGEYTERYFSEHLQSYLIKSIFKNSGYSQRKNYRLVGQSGEKYKFKFMFYNRNRKILYDPIVFPEDGILNIIKFLDLPTSEYIYLCSLPNVEYVLAKYKKETGRQKDTYGVKKYKESFKSVLNLLQRFGVHYIIIDPHFVVGLDDSKTNELTNELFCIDLEDIILGTFLPFKYNKSQKEAEMKQKAFNSCQIALDKGYDVQIENVPITKKYDDQDLFTNIENTIIKLSHMGYIVKNIEVEKVIITEKGQKRIKLLSEQKKTILQDIIQRLRDFNTLLLLAEKFGKIYSLVKESFR